VAIYRARWSHRLVIKLASRHVSGFAYRLTTKHASKLAKG